MRYELFVALRYLRAKRREAFISLITWISTLGIAIGVMTLTITLAVMTGFESDLRDRILAFNPHVSIWGQLGTIANPGQRRGDGARPAGGRQCRAVHLRPAHVVDADGVRRRAGARHPARGRRHQ